MVKDCPALQPRAQSRRQHLESVLEPAHMADLTAGIGGDWKLDNAPVGIDELDRNVGVEIEIGRIECERQRAQRLDAVGAIASVKLGQPLLQHSVLQRSENA